MMLMCSKWTMWVLAGALMLGCNQPTGPLSLPAAVGRPDDASQGPRVGVIVTGRVTIVPSKGNPFPGLLGQQLLRDDKLVTAADSFVVVQLHNGHLVRLGASATKVVEMLAPFHDPQAGEDLGARFVRLLTPDERNDPALSGAITRVAGWNTRMSASQSFAALPTPEPAKALDTVSAQPEVPGVSPTPVNHQGYGGSAAAASVADSKQLGVNKAPLAPAKTEESNRPVDGSERSPNDGAKKSTSKNGKSSNRAGSGPSDEEEVGGHVPPAAPVPSEPESTPAPRLPAKVAFRPASGGQAHTENLPEPLRTGGAALAACAGAGAKITGTVKGGKLVTLKVDGKVMCQTLVGKASTLADGNFELTVLK